MHLVAIGGSDAGISAALRARELDPGCDVTVIVADAYGSTWPAASWPSAARTAAARS